MLTYRLVHSKHDLEMQTLLDDCEELRFLKSSKHYSSKAYAYPEEPGRVLDPLEVGRVFLKTHQMIAAREVWTYTVLVEKPSSLLCW